MAAELEVLFPGLGIPQADHPVDPGRCDPGAVAPVGEGVDDRRSPERRHLLAGVHVPDPHRAVLIEPGRDPRAQWIERGLDRGSLDRLHGLASFPVPHPQPLSGQVVQAREPSGHQQLIIRTEAGRANAPEGALVEITHPFAGAAHDLDPAFDVVSPGDGEDLAVVAPGQGRHPLAGEPIQNRPKVPAGRSVPELDRALGHGRGDQKAVRAHRELFDLATLGRDGAGGPETSPGVHVPARYRAVLSTDDEGVAVRGERQRRCAGAGAVSRHVQPFGAACGPDVPDLHRGPAGDPGDDPIAAGRERHTHQAAVGVLGGDGGGGSSPVRGDLSDPGSAVITRRRQAGTVGTPRQ